MNINRNIIFFLGECNFCNSTDDSIIKNYKKDIFHIFGYSSTMQKKIGQKAEKMDTIMVIHDQKIYIKPDAIFEILKNLSYPTKILYILKFFPKIVRNFVYDITAKNIYSMFGKSDSCQITNKQNVTFS